MVGKIKYLVKNFDVKIEDILCITFTNNAAQSLETKIKKELGLDNKVYTFHKLALEILDDHKINYEIAPPTLLEYLVEEIFYSIDTLYFRKLFLTNNYINTREFKNYKNTSQTKLLN